MYYVILLIRKTTGAFSFVRGKSNIFVKTTRCLRTVLRIDWRAIKRYQATINETKRHTFVDTIRTAARCKYGIRQRRNRSLYTTYKILFYRLSSSRSRALLEFIPTFPVGFPRSFLPSASVMPRNSNFRLPSLATVRILCVWGISFALHARASHIWHVARDEGARIFNALSTFGVGLLQKFN